MNNVLLLTAQDEVHFLIHFIIAALNQEFFIRSVDLSHLISCSSQCARYLQAEAAKWLSLDAELVMRDSEVVGTKNPTGNSLLVECRFELPFGE